jgi:hypothetical protein
MNCRIEFLICATSKGCRKHPVKISVRLLAIPNKGFHRFHQAFLENAVISENKPKLPPNKSVFMSLLIIIFPYHSG